MADRAGAEIVFGETDGGAVTTLADYLAAGGFQALATTSAGFAWSLGKLDQRVTRA